MTKSIIARLNNKMHEQALKIKMFLKNFINVIAHLYHSDFICFTKNVAVSSKCMYLKKKRKKKGNSIP